MTTLPTLKCFEIRQNKLCFHEWGSIVPNQTTIVLLHATGFHGRCWDAVVRQLNHDHVIAVDMRGHGNSEGVPFNDWSDFGEDIVELIKTLTLSNVVIVGHSLGGFTAAYVAHEMPDVISKVMLIDPVILPKQYYGLGITMSEATKLSKVRTDNFATPDDFFNRYQKRPPYSLFEPEVYQSYCQHALNFNAETEAYNLACRPNFEASIYDSFVSYGNIYTMLERIEQPTYILRAMSAPSFDGFFGFQYSPTNPELVKHLKNGKDFHLQEHTHFIPLQDTAITVEYIHKLLNE